MIDLSGVCSNILGIRTFCICMRRAFDRTVLASYLLIPAHIHTSAGSRTGEMIFEKFYENKKKFDANILFSPKSLFFQTKFVA